MSILAYLYVKTHVDIDSEHSHFLGIKGKNRPLFQQFTLAEITIENIAL